MSAARRWDRTSSSPPTTCFQLRGANHSARSYQQLSEALERLQGTQIKTNIEAGGGEEVDFFSWLSEVRLCDWLHRAILRDKQVLAYATAYFQLGPVERRIYEVACATAEDGRLEIDLATFRLQVGYQNPLANFRAAMKAIAQADAIPDYQVALVEDTETEEPVEGRGRGRRAPAPAWSSRPVPRP